jgi:hypothetical protein
MLLLPNGRGLVSLATTGWYEVEFSRADFVSLLSWTPTITSFPATVIANQTVTLAGIQLCGLSECASYGDDNQQAENYPIVRFIDSSGEEVTYVRAHDVSTRSIAPGVAGSVLVDIPTCLEPGIYSVVLVTMGIPSIGVQVTVELPLQNDFEVVVGCGDGTIGRFYRDNSAFGYPWSGRADGFLGVSLTHVSLISSHLFLAPGVIGVPTLEAVGRHDGGHAATLAVPLRGLAAASNAAGTRGFSWRSDCDSRSPEHDSRNLWEPTQPRTRQLRGSRSGQQRHHCVLLAR